MFEFLKSILKVFLLRHKCAHSIRSFKTSIKNHLKQVESMSDYFKKVTSSYNNILSASESASKIFETAENDLLNIYQGEWNSMVKLKLSEQILLLRDNKKYLQNLKSELDMALQTTEKL